MTRTPTAILCQRILAVLPDRDEEFAQADVLDLSWRQMQSRALIETTRAGRMVRIILPADQQLQHGAVLHDDGRVRVAVNLLACQVLIVRPATMLEFARCAYVLGNLHIPAQITPEEILLPADGAAQAALENLGIRYDVQARRFQPEADALPRLSVKLQ